MKLSEAQRKWLTHLRDHGPDSSRNMTGYFCRKNGLTEWVCRDKASKEVLGVSEARQFYPEDFWSRIEFLGETERITPAGIKALEG
ncbi:hypothetical protein [Pyruvatibacter mobilis]|uniref:hypothetical protein n=1 Tax=Pyruvatibacter mobilis TaxID=1712261 RepID=UPI003BB15771